MPSWTSLSALTILLGLGPTYLRMDAEVSENDLEGSTSEVLPVASLEKLSVEDLSGTWEMDTKNQELCWRRRWAPLAADLTRWLDECSEAQDVGGTAATLTFFILTAVLDAVVLVKFLFRLASRCRRKVGFSTTTAVVVQQLRLPCRPEHFEIHSEDEDESTPRPKEVEQDTEIARVKLELEQACARIQALEKELLQQKEMNVSMKEELRAREVQADANAVLQSELQVSRKELLECQEEANVMRVQLDALAEMRSGQVPCRDCLSVFADWLKASLNDMAVQIPMQLQVIHNPKQQLELRQRLDRSRKPSVRKAPTSTSSGGLSGFVNISVKKDADRSCFE